MIKTERERKKDEWRWLITCTWGGGIRRKREKEVERKGGVFAGNSSFSLGLAMDPWMDGWSGRPLCIKGIGQESERREGQKGIRVNRGRFFVIVKQCNGFYWSGNKKQDD